MSDSAAHSTSSVELHDGVDPIAATIQQLLGREWTISDRIFQFYPSLGRAKRFVDDNYAEDISMAQVARVAGLEKKYFSTYFKAKCGVPFRQWLSSVRVRRAIERMGESDQSLTHIAWDVGFQDLRTFERTFKRMTGLTPREVKRRLAPTSRGTHR